MIDGETIRQQFVGKTEKEAYNKLVEFVKDISEHGMKKRFTKEIDSSIASIAYKFEETRFKNGDIKANSYIRLKQTIKTISTYQFANIPIHRVTRRQIENFLQNERIKADETIKKEYRLIKRVFKIACKKKLLGENFFESDDPITCPKSFQKAVKVEALSRTEEFILTQYLKSSYSQYKYIILLALYTRYANR